MSETAAPFGPPSARVKPDTQMSAAARKFARLEQIGSLLLVVIALGAPLLMTDIYQMNVLIFAAINAVLATGLAIVVHTGRLSLAQATFGGVGGYMSGVLVMHFGWNYWLAVTAAAICAAGCGVLLALTSLRLRGFYFAIATLTFGQLTNVILGAWSSVTGGFSGMFGIPNPPPIGPFSFANPLVYYYFVLIVLAVVLGIRHVCSSGSRFGRALTILGEDEVLASAIGVPSTPYRLAAFAISSAIGGVAGSLNAHFIQGISPPDVAPIVSVFILVMVMAGGIGTLSGPVIGAVILTAIPEFLRASAQWSMFVYGVFLVGYTFLFRNGIVALIQSVFRRVVGDISDTDAPAGLETKPVLHAPLEPLSSAEPRADASVIEFRDVRCSFGENTVLESVSFVVRGGRIHGLIGPNGAGKTTLFNVITGNAPLSDGKILFRGSEVQPSAARMARLGIARTFQHARVFPRRTTAENIALAAEMANRAVDHGYLARLMTNCGLDSLRDLRASRLTHFQRRLITIAMAFAPAPDLILLDEPLAGLDDTETLVLRDLISALQQQTGCTILLIEHKLSVVMRICDALTVLDGGRIIAEGPPDAVARDEAVIEAYLGA